VGSSNTFLKKAVIPAAGLGSRMLPISKSVPKEMFPTGRKPMIQHTVEEALASGIERICIVIRKGKDLIRDYFSLRYPHPHKRDESFEELEKLVASCEITFIYQEQPLGLGDAMLQAQDFVGDDWFVMMVPDQLMECVVPPTLQLLRSWKPGLSIWSSLARIPKEDLCYFVGARAYELEKRPDLDYFAVGKMRLEDDSQFGYGDSGYEIRGFGRTIYPSEIFDYLGRDYMNARTGEVDLLKTFERCTEKILHYGVLLEGRPLDLGTFGGYYRYLPRLWQVSGHAR
jgi:UTP--glucose-1-phosphate uridylyltransferase